MAARILIAEDEAIVGKDLERMLVRQGYTVCQVADSGEDAIAGAQLHHPDLILMDIKLRGEMDGVAAAERIHDLFDLPVVYLTAHSDRNTLERAKVSQPYGYLLKPVEPRELNIVVEMALNLHQSERKRLEREVQYHTLFETALDGFWVVNLEGRFLDVNEAYCTLMGYARAELLQRSISDLEAVEDPQEVAAHISEISEVGWGRFESRHRTKDGGLIDFEISVRFIREQKLIFVYLRDITARKRHETEILQLNNDLVYKAQESQALYQMEREQREFAQMLSEASQLLVSTLDMDVMLDRIMEQISRIVENDVCNIMLLEGEQIKTVRSCGYETFDAGSFIETFVFPLSGLSVRQQIIKTKEAIVVPDVRHDPRWSGSGEGAWLRSYIAVPILIQSQVVGFINVGSSMPDYYTLAQAQRLQVFAYQAGLAVQNARLFAETSKTVDQLEVLSHKLLEIQETERRTIARELHDEVGQGLTAVKLNLQALLNLPNAELFQTDIRNCVAVVEVILKQVRNISLDLHPSLLDDLGLIPALRWLVDKEAQWYGFSAQVVADRLEDRLPALLELVCYRVVQEALTNVARHAQAQHIHVELWKRGADLHLVIQDDGIGFNVSDNLENGMRGFSLGLLGMRERVALVQGKIEINSAPGEGTEIHARFPLNELQPENLPDWGRGLA